MAATCHSSGCKWPQGAVGPQVAASGATGESGVAASGGRKWSQVAKVAAWTATASPDCSIPLRLKKENASKELKRKEEQKGGEELKRKEGSNESKERVATKEFK